MNILQITIGGSILLLILFFLIIRRIVRKRRTLTMQQSQELESIIKIFNEAERRKENDGHKENPNGILWELWKERTGYSSARDTTESRTSSGTIGNRESESSDRELRTETSEEGILQDGTSEKSSENSNSVRNSTSKSRRLVLRRRSS